MKITTALFAAALFAVAVSRIQAQTLNWGNEMMDGAADSGGVTHDNTFVLEFGSIVSNFVPTDWNFNQWVSDSDAFNPAVYCGNISWFTSTADLKKNVIITRSSLSLAGLDAYIWTRNDAKLVKGTQWLLTRVANWTVPSVGGDPSNSRIIEWVSVPGEGRLRASLYPLADLESGM